MNGEGQTREQLVEELEALRRQVDRGKQAEAELKQRLAALTENSENLRLLLETAEGFAIYQLAFDEDSPHKARVVVVSTSIKDILGLSEPLKIETWFEQLHPDDAGRIVEANLRSWATGETLDETGRFFHPVKKEWRWLRAIAKGVLDPKGKSSWCTGLMIDVTEQKQAEQAAKEARENLARRVEERTAELAEANQQLRQEIAERRQAEEALNKNRYFFQSIIERSSDSTSVLDSEGTIIYQSPSIKRLLGYEPEEMVGQNPFTFIHPDDMEKVLTLFNEGKKCPGVVGKFEYRFRHKDGSWRVLEAIGTNLLHDELIGGLVINYRDITDRKRAEEALRTSNEKFEKIFNSQLEAILILDKNIPPHILDCHPAMTQIFGHTKEDILGQTVELLHVNERTMKELQKKLYSVIEKQGFFSISDFPMKRQDGEVFPTDLYVLPLVNESGQRTGWVSVVRDITERKRAMEERDRLFNLSIDMLCIAGFDGYFKQLNPAWTKTLGWTSDELRSKPWLDFVHPDDRQATIEAGEQLAQGREVFTFENRYLCRDGSYRWISWNSFPLSDQALIFAVARDITEHKRYAQEREKLITELQIALAEVRTLSGLLPICSNCKKIRDDRGYWQQVEKYIGEHTGARFSHSICPDCLHELYPGLADRVARRIEEKKEE
ncbi:MAG: PAS domain S-box protein [Thermodesulfobacteriota bacterium]